MDVSNDKAGAGGLGTAFGRASAVKTPGTRRGRTPAPFSLRLTPEERARLDAAAGSQPLGAYIRSRLFDGEAAASTRRQARRPVQDERELASLLAVLGQSRIANNLNQLAKAANSGSFLLSPDGEASLREACEAVTAMRRTLMNALGLERGPDRGSERGSSRGERP